MRYVHGVRPHQSFAFALFAVTLLWVMPLGGSAAELASDAALEVELVSSGQLRAAGRDVAELDRTTPAVLPAAPELYGSFAGEPLPAVRMPRAVRSSPVFCRLSLGRAPPLTSH